MRKRFPALIPFLALLLCVTVRAAGPRLEVHLPESPVEAGEEFAVTVDLTGNPGIRSIQYTLAFDKSRMECVSAKRDGLLTQAGASVSNPSAEEGAIIVAAAAQPMTGDGSVGAFRFRAKDKLSDFHFSIEELTVSDQNGNPLEVLVTNAKPSGDSDTPKSDGTSVSDTPKSGGTSVSGAPKSDGTSVSDTPKSDGASVSNTPKSDEATSTAQASPSGPTASPPFTDVAGTWAEDYIRTAAERNLFQGYADGTFRPNNRLTRAQFMMVLWNLAGRPDASKPSPFEDMDTQIENFRKAVTWAYSKGFVNGTSPTTFSPTAPLTRQAAMKILFAYNGGRRGAEVMTASAYDSIFTDSGQISAWAKDAMYWAVYQTILSGSTPSTLNPGGIVTRAQLAAIMVRYTNRFPS